MPSTPLDFYDQHIWRGIHGCTRCGQLFHNHKDMIQHCKDGDCIPVDNEEIPWM